MTTRTATFTSAQSVLPMRQGLGVAPGERVFALTGRIPDLYISAIGTLKNNCVFSPLFSAFGHDPVQSRMSMGRRRVLVTTEILYRRKVAQVRSALPDLTHVLIVRQPEEASELPADTLDFHALLEAADPEFVIPRTDPEEMALLHFTSGTTGRPKGAMHAHAAVIVPHMSGKLALDIHPEDVFWCTADPG